MNIQRAIEFVVRCHAGQTRKGRRNGIALPYVTHCFEVFKVLWLCGACDEITGPAALGHDLIEECPNLDPSLIREHLGERAAEVVCELTFLPDSQDSRPTSEQKAQYIARFRQKSAEAIAIKVCDRYVNLVDFLNDDPGYAREYLTNGEAIFGAVELRHRDIEGRFGREVADRLLKLRTDLLLRMSK